MANPLFLFAWQILLSFSYLCILSVTPMNRKPKPKNQASRNVLNLLVAIRLMFVGVTEVMNKVRQRDISQTKLK
jgi:arginine exporter protein ArgO